MVERVTPNETQLPLNMSSNTPETHAQQSLKQEMIQQKWETKKLSKTLKEKLITEDIENMLHLIAI